MTKDGKIKLLELELENAELKLANASLTKRVASLEAKVLLLLNLIEKHGVKKDSHNSHNPPSQDKGKPKRNKSLREKTGRKPGGQQGHKGHTHYHKETPDEIIELKSNFCTACGENLSDSSHQLVSKRQLINGSVTFKSKSCLKK